MSKQQSGGSTLFPYNKLSLPQPVTRSRFVLSLIILITLLTGSISHIRQAQAARGIPPQTELQEEPPYGLHLPVIFNKFPVRTIFGIESVSSNEMPHIVDLPASWMRYNGAIWANVEPTEGERKWSALATMESRLRAAQQGNVRPIVIVRQTPEWARLYEDAGCGPIKPEKLQAFGRFMFDLVKRYSAPPYNVLYWEIWNEPDVSVEIAYQKGGSATPFGCWGNYNDPYFGGEYYAEMLKYVYPQVKAANPRAQVVIGGLLLGCNPNTTCPGDVTPLFFEGILRNQGAEHFDYLGFHNYDYYLGASSSEIGPYGSPTWESYWDTNGPSIIAKVNFLHEVMATYGVDKPLLNTETALLCGGFDDPPGGVGCEAEPNSSFELTKAAYIVHSYVSAMVAGLDMNMWYHVNGWRNSGLIFTDQTPRPAYTTLAFARAELADAQFMGALTLEELNNNAKLVGYKFERGGLNARQIWVIWAIGRGTHTLNLTTMPTAVWNYMGEAILDPYAPQTIEINTQPVYIEWPAP